MTPLFKSFIDLQNLKTTIINRKVRNMHRFKSKAFMVRNKHLTLKINFVILLEWFFNVITLKII